jgi:hypothetical protein
MSLTENYASLADAIGVQREVLEFTVRRAARPDQIFVIKGRLQCWEGAFALVVVLGVSPAGCVGSSPVVVLATAESAGAIDPRAVGLVTRVTWSGVKSTEPQRPPGVPPRDDEAYYGAVVYTYWCTCTRQADGTWNYDYRDDRD